MSNYYISNFEPVDAPGIVKAVFDVEFVDIGLTIKKCRLLVPFVGSRRIRFPARKVTDGRGLETWCPHVSIDDPELFKEFERDVLREIAALEAEGVKK
jgi:hypothetical protein